MNPMINVEQFWKDYCAYENVNYTENFIYLLSFKYFNLLFNLARLLIQWSQNV